MLPLPQAQFVICQLAWSRNQAPPLEQHRSHRTVLILQVSETEHSSHTRDDMLYSLSTLVGRLENLEVLNLEQSPRKEWSALSKYQLRLLLLQLQWRQEKPGKGPLGALKHLNINPFVTGEQAVFSHLSDPGYP